MLLKVVLIALKIVYIAACWLGSALCIAGILAAGFNPFLTIIGICVLGAEAFIITNMIIAAN